MTNKRPCPITHILAGGSAQDHYENRVRNLKEQVAWVGIDDAWREPGMLPTQAQLYHSNIDIIDIERAAFIDTMKPATHDLLRDANGDFVNYRIASMWDTWLAARIGFIRGSY